MVPWGIGFTYYSIYILYIKSYKLLKISILYNIDMLYKFPLFYFCKQMQMIYKSK